MIDPFGRSLNYLRMSVTDRCNLRCQYCMPEEGIASVGHGSILSYEELLRVARVASRLGIRKIRVTGGDPLVRKGIVNFLGQLASLPEKPEITLTTNGLRLAEFAVDLKAAGVNRVNVSLDTLRTDRFERITRRAGLDQVLAGLEAAESAGLGPLKLNMVPMAGINSDEIADFARLTLDRPWDVRFIELMPVSSRLEVGEKQRVPLKTILAELRKLGELETELPTGPHGPAQLFRLPGAQGCLGVIPAVSSHFCNECNRLRVTADGRIRPCLFSDQEIDLRSVLRDSADDQPLEELFRQAASGKPNGHNLKSCGCGPGDRLMQQIGG